jgi:hypothetical protein
MAIEKLRLDSAGIGSILNSGKVQGLASSLANSVAGAARGATASGMPIPVEVRSRVAAGGRLRSPRGAYDVTLKHPAGLKVEAKRSPLLRAAISVGLSPVRLKGMR